MRLTFYYTVILCKTFFMIKYATPEGRILTWPSTFDPKASAEEQFKQATHGKLEKLSNSAFEKKVNQLASHYRQDLAMLQSWIDGKGVSV